MADRVQLDDTSLGEAGSALIAGAHLLVAGNLRLPADEIPSLIGVGGDVERFLQGLQLARSALSYAATSASESVAAMMRDSDALDREIAGSLSGIFSAKGRRG